MTTDTRRWLKWLIVALLTVMSYIAFRAYLAPEMLFNFANSLYC